MAPKKVVPTSITQAVEMSTAKRYAKQVKKTLVARKKIVNFLMRDLARQIQTILTRKNASKTKNIRQKSLLTTFKHYFDEVAPKITSVKRTRKQVKRAVVAQSTQGRFPANSELKYHTFDEVHPNFYETHTYGVNFKNTNVISYYNCTAVMETFESSYECESEQEYNVPEPINVSEDDISDIESIDSEESDKADIVDE